MIPADVASRLRLVTPEQPAAPQSITPSPQLADVLTELVPGQRLMAEIQALLPNGAYRAVVGQRDVTLALPFSAKPGDSLELEVVETNGKLTLAFVANRGEGDEAGAQSVATRLSQTGRLIGDLLSGVGQEGKKAEPAPLNGNQPIVNRMPTSAAELVPMLKEALTRSGMFYEAHQARWAEGKLSRDALLQQPQGQLSPILLEPRAPAALPSSAAFANASIAADTVGERVATATTGSSVENVSQARTTIPVAPELAPLVQQQLDALATQNYVWQGQVWPGQQMHWEITEEGNHRQNQGEDAPERWQTQLNLRLPNLGGVGATIRLRSDKEVEISLTAETESSRSALAAAGNGLRQQLDSAGLTLTNWAVNRGEPAI